MSDDHMTDVQSKKVFGIGIEQRYVVAAVALDTDINGLIKELLNIINQLETNISHLQGRLAVVSEAPPQAQKTEEAKTDQKRVDDILHAELV